MSLTRKTQKLFCGNAVATPGNTLKQFGSLAAGSPIATSDPAVIQALSAWLNGWAAATIAVGSPPQPVPPMQDFNAALYVITYQLQYILDRGMAEYDAGTTYGQFSFCQVNGVIYRSNVANNTGNNPPTSPTQWLNFSTLFDAAGAAAAAQSAAQAFATAADAVVQSNAATDATAKANAAQSAAIAASDPAGAASAAVAAIQPQICKGWITFSGVSMTIFDSFNVAGISRIATGKYNIQWTNPPGNQNYPWHGNCGAPDGNSPGSGDNNIVVGLGTVNSTNLTIGCWDPNVGGSGRFEDANFITIAVFGPSTV